MSRCISPEGDLLIDQVIPVLDKGHVILLDYMGGDNRIVEAARVSFGKGTKTAREDAKLIEYLIKNGHCVTVDTKILTRDLRWVEAGNLKFGDKLLGFNENPGNYSGPIRTHRNYCESTVLSNNVIKSPVYIIELENGDILKSTGDHKWLSNKRRGNNSGDGGGNTLEWISTIDIEKLLIAGKIIRIPKYLDVWKEITTYDSGYIAGAFDADGCFSRNSRHPRLNFVQLDNKLREEVHRILYKNNFKFHAYIQERSKYNPNHRDIERLRILGGMKESIRFLGVFRPKRLLDKWLEEEIRFNKFKSDNFIRIKSCRLLGEQNIAALSTSSETYIAEGYPAHNTSPFEQVQITCRIHLPIFIARQLARYRSASANERSLRYSEFEEEFYTPEPNRIQRQSQKNKQASAEPFSDYEARQAIVAIEKSYLDSLDTYRKLIDSGVSREIARIVLPVSSYTTIYWTNDLRNIFNFLKQRLDHAAQPEIQEYAKAILKIIRAIAPVATEAFERLYINKEK